MQTDLFGKPPNKPSKNRRGKSRESHAKSNALARQIKAYVNFHKEAVAYRLSYGVRVNTESGRLSKGEVIKTIFATGQDTGLSDVVCVVRGMVIWIEVKIGNDKMSPSQKERKEEIERAGGLWWEVKTITEFKRKWDDLYRRNQ